MKLILKGGIVIDPGQKLEGRVDLLIVDGKVAALGEVDGGADCQVVDCSGLLVFPGFVDMHVHLREPGREDKETIETGSRAAVSGGFTSVACMPNTTPVNDCETVTKHILDRARQAALANVFPVGAVTKGQRGEELAEIGEMVKAGVVAISDDGRPVQNSQVMRRALEYARIFDIPVLDHCEDVNLAANGCMNEGPVSTEVGLRGLSRTAEEVHVARDLMLARETGSRVHICHISTWESLDWVRAAKERGVRMTCEVTPHHFLLSDAEVRGYDTNYKMNPPLRSGPDIAAMVKGLKDGTIDCIATDHAPHTILDKDATFEEAANGIIGLETAVPLVWEHLVHTGTIGLQRAAELLSVNPSRILKLGRGSLAPDAVADVTVVDPNREQVVEVSKFQSKARNSPFQGMKLRGWPVCTIVAGRVVWRSD